MATQRFQVVSAALLLILAAGCGGRSSSVPHGTQNAAGGVQGASRAAKSVSPSGGLFHPNSEKYSDDGAKPDDGRDREAHIQSRALFAKDGTTLVEATTGVLDGPAGPGVIKRVRAKIFAVDGSLQLTQRFTHINSSYWSHTFAGLARNDRVRLNTHTALNDDETEGVITNTKVKLRPDLMVRSVTGPPQALVGTPVTFQAEVSEINGDVGAHADCVLSVDGMQVDTAQAIWVDASHTVSCVFQYSFPTSGTKTVQVAVTNVVPGDWDLANNSAQTTIQIVPPGVVLGYQAGISNGGRSITSYDKFTGALSAYSNETKYTESTFSAYLLGFTYRAPITFPIQQFAGSVTIDGTVAWQPTFTGQLAPPVSTPDSTCQSQYTDSAYGIVCSFASGYSFAEWLGSTGRVTYFSSHTDYTCAGGTCTQNNYTSNTSGYTYGTGAPALDIGTTEQMSLTLLDAAGTTFSANTKTMTATPNSYTFGSDTCYTYSSGTYCNGSHETDTAKRSNDSAPDGM